MDRAVFDMKNERPQDVAIAYRLGIRYVFGVGEFVWRLNWDGLEEASSYQIDKPDAWTSGTKPPAFQRWFSYAIDEPDTGGQVQERIRPLFQHIKFAGGRTLDEYAMSLAGMHKRFIGQLRIPRGRDGLPTYTSLWGGSYGWGMWRWRRVADMVGTEFYCLGGPWHLWPKCLIKLAVCAISWIGRPWVVITNSYVARDPAGRWMGADTYGGQAELSPVPAWQIRLWETLARVAGAYVFALLGWSEHPSHPDDEPSRRAILEAWRE